MKKEILSLIVMLAGCSMINAETFNGSCGQNLTWSLNTEDSTLVIQGEGAMDNWNQGGSPWYDYAKRSRIAYLYLPNKLTSIGDFAFELCTKLKKVIIPANVRSIGRYAFEDCTNLSDVVFPDNLLSIEERAFRACQHLLIINIPDNVETIGKGAFESCVALEKIFFPQHLSRIEACTLGACRSLLEVTIPNDVTFIGHEAFGACESLKSIFVPNNVTEIEYSAFNSCSGLLSITLGANLEIIGERAFSSCQQIKSVTCYAIDPPIMKREMPGDRVFGRLDCTDIPLIVPFASMEKYSLADQWDEFKNVLPIKAEGIVSSEVLVVPAYTTVDITWPNIDNASTYELIICDNKGNVLYDFNFDSAGVLVYSTSGNELHKSLPRQIYNAGYKFTVMGLIPNTEYAYSIIIKDELANILSSFQGDFTTMGIETAIFNCSSKISTCKNKYIRNGQFFIQCGDELFNAQGARVE